MEIEKFSVDYRGYKIVGDVIPAGTKPEIIFLHGAGQSDRGRWQFLRETLATKEINSAGFDFIGHGETGGQLTESSLKDRTDQTTAVINFLRLQQPLKIAAASMSGYTAVKLTENYKVGAMFLFVPCAYDVKAYSVNFGSQFSAIIRQPQSWLNSDAWPILSRYGGGLSVFAAGKDQIVPREVVEKIYASAGTKDKELKIFAESSHQLAIYLQNHPKELTYVVDKIYSFIKS